MDFTLQTCPVKRPKYVPVETPVMTERARTDYRVMPIFEGKVCEQALKKHYSLETNEYLQCHWRRCMEKFFKTGAKRSKPFQLPHHGDYHFYNGEIKYRPAESLFRKTNFKYNFKPGPGYDHIGELPIPNEMKYSRSLPAVNIEEPVLIKQTSSEETSGTLKKEDIRVKQSRIPPRRVEKKTVLESTYLNNSIASVGRPVSGKHTKKLAHKTDKHTTVTKTTIQVTEEATVKVNKEDQKITVQNKCTVAVHNRHKSTLT